MAYGKGMRKAPHVPKGDPACKLVHIYLNESETATLNALARDCGRTRSYLIRTILRAYLKSQTATETTQKETA